MGFRTTSLTVAIFIASFAACDRAGEQIRVGDRVPPAWFGTYEKGTTVVAFVFRPKDCLTCQVGTQSLRDLRHLKSQIQFLGIQVGDSEVPAFVRSFFARERLEHVKIVPYTGNDIGKRLAVDLPAMIVVAEGRLRHISPAASGQREGFQLVEFVESMQQATPAASSNW